MIRNENAHESTSAQTSKPLYSLSQLPEEGSEREEAVIMMMMRTPRKMTDGVMKKVI
jgi:hypothetical protein